MRFNYGVGLLLVAVILFRSSLLNLTNNVMGSLFVKDNALELQVLAEQNEYLKSEYQSLLDFKNNINLNYEYTITNVIKNNYGFHNLIINGTDYKVGDEVISEKGLVGTVAAINKKNTEVKYLYNTNMVVNINNETGKIMGRDDDNNLLIKEISNYNNIKLNDLVYSTYGTLIGKVMNIKYETLDNYLTVKTANLDNTNYVAVIGR